MSNIGQDEIVGRDGLPSGSATTPTDSVPQLRARLALLSEAERISHIGSYVWDVGKASLWSDEFYRILGYEPGEVPPSSEAFYRSVHPHDLQRVQEAHRRAALGELPDIEYRVCRVRTGEVRIVQGSGRADRDSEGRVIRIIGAIADITEARNNAIALEEALAIARASERIARTGTFVVRRDPLEIHFSDGLNELTKLYDPNVDPQTRLALVHPEDRERLIAWWRNAVKEKRADPIQIRMLRSDGEVRHMYTHAAPFSFLADGVERMVGTTMDVTERVALEEGVRHAAKMEAVGTLAAGVAHDFNNYLLAISSTLEFLKSAPAADERDEALEQAMRAVRRCTELTGELLTFARRQPFRPEVVDVVAVITRFRELLRQTLARRAELQLEVRDGALWARVDPRQIEQMLANLVVNAGDAIEQKATAGGRVRVVVERAVLERSERAMPDDVGPGPFICITVEDDGCGIPAAQLPRIFEPYFTTKPRGRGTGLGLASVYGMVRQNAGAVTVHLLPEGTRFCLWFPAVDEPAEPHGEQVRARAEQVRAQPVVASRAKAGRALVVDDIPQVRSVAACALAEEGFETLQAADGIEALAVLESAGPVRLLLTDVQMPRMDGRTLVDEVRRRSAAEHIVLMTGYADDSTLSGDAPPLPLLRKPFTLTELVQFVRRVLRTFE